MTILNQKVYPNWESFLNLIEEYGGIIEACPTTIFSDIHSSPSIGFSIEPDGELEYLASYDKINHEYFRCVAGISPVSEASKIVYF